MCLVAFAQTFSYAEPSMQRPEPHTRSIFSKTGINNLLAAYQQQIAAVAAGNAFSHRIGWACLHEPISQGLCPCTQAPLQVPSAHLYVHLLMSCESGFRFKVMCCCVFCVQQVHPHGVACTELAAFVGWLPIDLKCRIFCRDNSARKKLALCRKRGMQAT